MTTLIVTLTFAAHATPARAATGLLKWAPPVLNDPQTVQVTTQNPVLHLDDSKDYIVELGDTPVDATVKIFGGHNVLVRGGEVDVPGPPTGLGADGMVLSDQAANSTVQVEGVLLTGPGMSDGFGIGEESPNTTVQLENIRVDELHGVDEQNWAVQHPDDIQTTTGPTYLRIDNFTGYTPYQGFFLAPNDSHSGGIHNPSAEVDLDNVDLHHRQDMTANASVMLWQNTPFTMNLTNVWVDPGTPAHNPTFWPDVTPWSAVSLGSPPSGTFVSDDAVGTNYSSPGYVSTPEAIEAPTISGTPVEGQTLSATPGTWRSYGTPSYSYQWQRCAPATGCENIPGAASATYTPTGGDVGDGLTVVVTNGTGTAAAIPIGPVTNLASAGSQIAPAVSGTAADGQVLTLRSGAWMGAPTSTLTYQWQRCAPDGSCVNIPGERFGTYRLSAGDVGNTITATVTATSTSGATQSASADATSVVANPAMPSDTVLPAISGADADGGALTAATGSWSSPDKLTYTLHWLRCASALRCTSVSGGTYSSYGPTATDVGDTIELVVTVTDQEGQSTSATTRLSNPVAAPPAPVSIKSPAMSGVAADGQVLTGPLGGWKSPDKLSYTYHWQRCQTSGACSDITGAIWSAYGPTAADVGDTMRLVVTATDQEGQSTSTTASTSSPVAGPAAPVLTSAPTVTGTLASGATLSVSTGAWKSPDKLTYQVVWERCGNTTCNMIPGAIYTKYGPANSDVGDRLQAVVTATDQEGQSTQATVRTGYITTG